MGREANSAQSCNDGMVAVTEAALLRCTSMEIFWIKSCLALLSPVCSMTREPICRTNKCAQESQAPRVSTQRGEKLKEEIRVEYSLSFAISAEFASQLTPPEEVDTFKGARVSEQVKSQRRGKPLHQGFSNILKG